MTPLPSKNTQPLKRLLVLVKPLEKPMVVLMFVWMQKELHLTKRFLDLEQSRLAHIYYFWPRKDAWEEFKALLDSKPCFSELHHVFLLNQAT
ncbi:hypothetical protein EUTSA_v10002962mg [Eutrema salsugineum]|uniref:Uncharacterized protein n=1 Tax=Eutrema salsugineum TaxID=72664 RepID=V4KHY9_EUTSA|nr:hypothetical protein EUTSA_v10002962mg [Eutrema salsugineum]